MVLTQADGLPREVLIVILQLIRRRQADICFCSAPNAPPHHDETVDMLIEDCAAKELASAKAPRDDGAHSHFSHQYLVDQCGMQNGLLSRTERKAADCCFQGKYFLLYKHIAPSTWHYILARWITDCLLYITGEAKYVSLVLLCRRCRVTWPLLSSLGVKTVLAKLCYPPQAVIVRRGFLHL